MRTLFISDLHLENSRPDITETFEQLIRNEAASCDALYILGDLFESYIGDDENSDLHQRVSKALNLLKNKNIPVYLMHGNRDFLIGNTFIKRCGAILLKDPTVIDLYGKSTLLMHGDTLCTQDTKYLAFRKKARNRILQKLFLARSLKKRQEMAEKARSISRTHTQKVSKNIMDVTPEEIPLIMQKYQVKQLIHGHTHRPGIHYFWENKVDTYAPFEKGGSEPQRKLGKAGDFISLNPPTAQTTHPCFRGDRLKGYEILYKLRIILGDWEKTGHFLAYYPDGTFKLEFFG